MSYHLKETLEFLSLLNNNPSIDSYKYEDNLIESLLNSLSKDGYQLIEEQSYDNSILSSVHRILSSSSPDITSVLMVNISISYHLYDMI